MHFFVRNAKTAQREGGSREEDKRQSRDFLVSTANGFDAIVQESPDDKWLTGLSLEGKTGLGPETPQGNRSFGMIKGWQQCLQLCRSECGKNLGPLGGVFFFLCVTRVCVRSHLFHFLFFFLPENDCVQCQT